MCVFGCGEISNIYINAYFLAVSPPYSVKTLETLVWSRQAGVKNKCYFINICPTEIAFLRAFFFS